VVEIENGQAILRPHRSGAGMLSRYAKPSHGRSVEESVGRYLGALDAKTRSRAWYQYALALATCSATIPNRRGGGAYWRGPCW